MELCLIRIKIYNKDGTIIYSDEKELIGKRFEKNEELKESLEGHLEAKIKRNLLKEENVFEKKYGALMEIYVPLYHMMKQMNLLELQSFTRSWIMSIF